MGSLTSIYFPKVEQVYHNNKSRVKQKTMIFIVCVFSFVQHVELHK